LTCSELFSDLYKANALFPPQKETSYSNIGFDLLGQVLTKVSGQTYEDCLSSITGPLGLQSTSALKPNDSVGVIVPGGGASSAWDIDMGVGNPSVQFPFLKEDVLLSDILVPDLVVSIAVRPT
jgi:CubicO group peptidase (beta-lactamase class C family)